jgi:hypothetical protein
VVHDPEIFHENKTFKICKLARRFFRISDDNMTFVKTYSFWYDNDYELLDPMNEYVLGN